MYSSFADAKCHIFIKPRRSMNVEKIGQMVNYKKSNLLVNKILNSRRKQEMKNT